MPYKKLFILSFSLLSFLATNAYSQDKTFVYSIDLQGTASTDDYLPFWLYSNQHGIIDRHSPGANAIINFQKNLMDDESGFDYGFGATFVSRYSENETIFFSQLYGSLSYGVLEFKGGRFYEQLGTVDSSLSMGSLAISQNATPMPKIKIGIPEYADVPLTQGYVEIKGEIAHGWFEKDREIRSPWLHQKAAYVRLGGNLPFRPYVGLTDQATWAGTGNQIEGDLPDSFNDFLRVLFGRSGNSDKKNSGENAYKLGDHRGIWDFGFYLDVGDFNILGYRQYPYNDGDGLRLRNPDALTGLSIEFPKDGQQIVSKILWEYLYTKNQNGPIPPPGNMRNGPGGRDNYYNNYLYRTGWTYEGLTIGNPLFLNAYDPQLGVTANYNLKLDRKFGVANNRIVAHHVGIEGELSSTVNYKIMATWSRNYGNYYDQDLYDSTGVKTDFYSVPEQWSFLTEFHYQPKGFESLRFNMSLAGDIGELYTDRIGVLFGVELLGTSSF